MEARESESAVDLSVREVTVSFGGILALDNVSVEVSRGEVLGIIGPNGAGKTTLFNVICGFVEPDSGTLSWRGQQIDRVRPDRLAGLGIARTLQGVGLLPLSPAGVDGRPEAAAGSAARPGGAPAVAQLDENIEATDVGLSRFRQLTLARRLVRAPEFGAGVAALLIYAFFAVVGGSRGFLSLTGTASWLNTASQLGIIAVPLGLLMISGSFDLSIGSMVGAGSVTVGVVTGYLHHSLWLALVVAAVIAIAVGFGNGLLVTRTAVHSFIVTLAANLVVAGLGLTVSLAVTGTTSVPVQASGFTAKLLDGQWHQLSVSVLWWAVVAIAGGWMLAQTRSGNWITATGGDPERARRAGRVATSRVTISLFVCTALASTFVGVLQAVQFTTGDPTTGQSYVFEAAIVVVIGGVLISGGYGTVLGVVLGTLIYGIADAGLFYTGWDTNYAEVLIGALMVIAVLTNNFLRRLATTTVRERRPA